MASAKDIRGLAHFVALDWANQLRQNMVAATVFRTIALAAVALLAP